MSVPRSIIRYLPAVGLCLATALVALPLRGWLDKANIAMLFLLAVFVVAVRLGRGPAVLTALLAVALFDFFFVPPHISFTVADAQYLVTFAVMLAVGLITSHLAAQLGERGEAAEAGEREMRVLYALACDLGATLSFEQVGEVLDRFLGGLGLRGCLLVSESVEKPDALRRYGDYQPSEYEEGQARSAYRDNASVESVALGATEPSALFLPFSGTTRVRGVLVAVPAAAGTVRAKRPLLNALASLLGVAVERIHFAEVAQQSEIDVKTEKLRSSILSSISHDLRTPLTSLVGLADSVAEARSGVPEEVRETAAIIRDQAHAMHRMVANLLDMARLHSGRVTLNRQWQPLDEVVGSSVRLLGELLVRRRLRIDLPADLPLVRFDAVLIERVFCNLLENAAKYSADDAAIDISARLADGVLEVSVCNDGAGFPAGSEEKVFELFARGGQQETAVPGTGIGLALCRAIVGAHGGTIVAGNRDGRACVRFTLPQERPPALDGDAEES